VDLDQDGRLDVYVGNDSMPDFAWYAGEDGRFVERGATAGLATNGSGAGQATMGIALADLDDDEIADVFTTNFANDTNTLRLSSGAARWRDASSVSGLAAVSRPYCGWSAAFGDFDLNGETDLIVFNGHVYPESVAQQLGSHRAQRALLFRGTGDRFERWLDVPALESPGCFRGAVLADLDRDGDQDVIATDITGPVRVLENTTESPSIVVELADSADLGARICLVEGDRRSTAWILSGAGYHSASARQAVFRAPTGPARLEVTWPDGSTSSFEGVTAGRRTVSRDGR
ncbi:MAG: CRTAC1 family protein, partial [Planctomycetota bacterium]